MTGLTKLAVTISQLQKSIQARKANGVLHVRKNIIDVGVKGKIPGNMMYQIKKDNPNLPRSLGAATMPKGIYVKGDVSKSTKGLSEAMGVKHKQINGKTKKGLNLITLDHEINEGVSAAKGEHTNFGAAFGHPNLSEIIGKESNIVATGGKSLKRAGKRLKKLREGVAKTTGGETEIEAMQRLMPIGKDGKSMKFVYGKTRLNRRMRKQMMKKEMGLSHDTTKQGLSKALSENRKNIKRMFREKYGD